MKHISRREFVALTVAGTAVSVASPFARGLRPSAAAITAADIVARIKKNIGADWGPDGVDTFKIGDPSMPVTGVVVTSMATLDVLQQAVKAGANFVISGEPTFYSRGDAPMPGGGRAGGAGRAAGAAGAGAAAGAAGAGAAAAAGAAGAGGAGRGQLGGRGGGQPAGPSPSTLFGPGTGASAAMPPAPTLPEPVVPAPARGGLGAAVAGPPAGTPDPVYAGKNAYIEKNKLVVFRLTDHWLQRKPDPRAAGLAQVMGWTKYKGADEMHYEIPPITLDMLASQLKKALGARGGMRAIGDQTMKIQKVGFLPGYTQIPAAVAMFPNVDLIIAGEVQEWETATYAQDVAYAAANFGSPKKAFISIGRILNDQPSMQVCADWLKTIVSEVPVKFISAGDPYWRPL